MWGCRSPAGGLRGAVSAPSWYGAAPRSKQYVSKGLFIIINSMILYFKHMVISRSTGTRLVHTNTGGTYNKNSHNVLSYFNFLFRLLFYATSGRTEIRKKNLDGRDRNDTTIVRREEDAILQLTIDEYKRGRIYWIYNSMYRVYPFVFSGGISLKYNY